LLAGIIGKLGPGLVTSSNSFGLTCWILLLLLKVEESLELKDQLNDESVIKPRAKLVEPSFNGPKFSIIIFF
jgi:hypothetical protein